MTEKALEAPPSGMMGRTGLPEISNCGCLPGMTLAETASLSMEAPPLYSQGLLTVEQLSQVVVDADIQAAVSEFLSGLSTQMFARIVRNGSAEVGGWLGAKIQGERNGWTTRLKMAMGEIELHRKHALLWGSALLDTSDHLVALLDFLNLVPQEPTVPEVTLDNMAESVHKLVDAISGRCSTLLEDRFECCQALNATIPPPARVSPVLNETLKKLEQELARIEDKAVQAEVESSKVRDENARMLAEVSKSQEEMKKKQSEMEMLKVQLKEIGKVVKVRKHTTAEKGVDTSSDFNSLKTIVQADCVGRVTTQSQGVNTLSTKRENMFTQTTRQPSIIEISEDKLRILKDRAKKLEHSIHDAISSMDKLKKGILYEDSPKETLKTSRTTSNSPSTKPPKGSCVQNWVMTSSFEVTNGRNTSHVIAAPKVRHAPKASDRKCFSERPPSKVIARNDDGDLVSDQGKVKGSDHRKLSRSRGAQVAKCLRCQKLFTATDNHKLACCFHAQDKERVEVYSDGGRLLKVQYIWKCCSQQAENDGCCYGHHI